MCEIFGDDAIDTTSLGLFQENIQKTLDFVWNSNKWRSTLFWSEKFNTTQNKQTVFWTKNPFLFKHKEILAEQQ